jgi:hypothetical protein
MASRLSRMAHWPSVQCGLLAPYQQFMCVAPLQIVPCPGACPAGQQPSNNPYCNADDCSYCCVKEQLCADHKCHHPKAPTGKKYCESESCEDCCDLKFHCHDAPTCMSNGLLPTGADRCVGLTVDTCGNCCKPPTPEDIQCSTISCGVCCKLHAVLPYRRRPYRARQFHPRPAHCSVLTGRRGHGARPGRTHVPCGQPGLLGRVLPSQDRVPRVRLQPGPDPHQ